MATSYGQRHLTSSLARRYYRQMKAGYADNIRSSQPSSAVDPYIAQGIADWQSTPEAAPQRAKAGEPTNPGSRLIDVLSQPTYAFVENLSDVGAAYGKARQGTLGGGDILEALSMFEDYGSGNQKKSGYELFTGDRGLYNEAARKAGVESNLTEDIGPLAMRETDSTPQKIAKAAGGFAGAVAFDPLTYLTLGTAGAATSGIGTLARQGGKAAATQAVGGGLEKAGAAATRLDNAINAIPGKAYQAAKSRIRPTPAVIDDVVEEAPKVVDDVVTPTEPKPLPEQFPVDRPITPEQAELIQSFLGQGAQGARNIVTQRMLKNGDEVIPYSSAEARKNVVPEYDWTRVKSESGKYLSPFQKPQVPLTNKMEPAQDIIEELAPATVNKQASDAAADATAVALKSPDAKVEPDEIRSWMSNAANEPLEVTIPGTGGKASITTSQTIGEWLERLNSKTAPVSRATERAIKTAITNAGMAAVRTARTRAAEAATASASPAAMIDSVSAPSVPAGGKNALEAVQRAGEGGGTNSSWVAKPSAEKARIRKRYQRLLEEEHFNYLYENQLRKDWTDDQKAKDFLSRLGVLRRGKSLSTPRYEEFYRSQIVFNPSQPFEAVMEGKAQLLSEAPKAFNEALSNVKPASEIMEEADTTLAATAQRQAERIYSGEELDEVSRSILKNRLGLGDSSVPGQQWGGRREDFPYTTNLQKSARNSQVFGEGMAVNVESYNGKAQMNIFRDLLVEANEALRQADALKPGYAGADAKIEYVLPRLKKIEEFLRAHGVEPTGGTAKRGVPISLGDTLEALMQTDKGRTLVRGRIFGGSYGIGPKGVSKSPGTIYVDSLMRVMGAVIENIDGTAINAAKNNVDLLHATAKAVADTIRGKRTDSLSSERIASILTENGKQPISTALRPDSQPKGITVGEPSGGFAVDVKPNKKGTKGKPVFGPYSAQVVKELEDVLFNSTEHGKADFRVVNALAQTVQARAAQYGIRFGDNVRELSNESMTEVMTFLDTNPGTKEMVDLLSDPDAIVKAVAKTKPIKPTTEEVLAAQLRLDEDLSDVLSLWDRKNIEAFRKISAGVAKDATAGGRVATNKAMMEVMDNAEDEILSAAPDMTPEELSVIDAEIMDTASFSRRAALQATNMFVPS